MYEDAELVQRGAGRGAAHLMELADQLWIGAREGWADDRERDWRRG
jgi:hypothetical protein